MVNYVNLNVQQLLQFAKGETFQGFTTIAGASSTYQSEGQALSYLDSQGWALAYVIGYGPMKEYLLKHA